MMKLLSIWLIYETMFLFQKLIIKYSGYSKNFIKYLFEKNERNKRWEIFKLYKEHD